MQTIKKIISFLFIPLILLYAAFKLFGKNAVEEAEESIKQTENTDKDLAQKQQAKVNAGNEALAEADKLKKEKEEIKNQDISSDWHLRR